MMKRFLILTMMVLGLGSYASGQTLCNSNNSVIGYAKGIPTKYAALYFFFRVF